MADHSEFIELAQELIAEDGRLVTLQKLSAGPQDATKPWKGAGTPTIETSQVNVPAVFLPASGTGFGKDFFREDLLKLCTQVAMVSPVAEGLESMTAILDTDGQRWKIVWGQVLKPADETILYFFGVAR